jgi:hypothetical protein
LAELLSLPSSAADLNLSPQRKRQKLHGDQAAALAALHEGLALADVTGEHFWDAELTALPGSCYATTEML